MEIVDGRDVMDSGFGRLESEEREQEIDNIEQTMENGQKRIDDIEQTKESRQKRTDNIEQEIQLSEMSFNRGIRYVR